MIWHYPDDDNKKALKEEKDSTLFSKKDFSWRTKCCSYLYPNIFIIDFDHTLAVHDSNDQLPSVYTRPFMIEFLEYLKKINKNNILILWTRAKKLYINKFVLLLGIANYFDHILSREECKISFKKYKCYKSFRYIIDNFPKYRNMRSFLIDNLAYKNGGGKDELDNKDNDTNYYFKLLSVKPFTIDEVNNGSDSTLLNLMLHLDEKFFKDDNVIKYKVYKVITVDQKGSLFLDQRFDASDCDVFVKSWHSKM